MGSSFASGFTTGFGSAFLQFTLERFATFGSFAWKKIGIIWGVEDELQKLHRTFLKIQDLLDHVGSSPLRFSGSGCCRAWQIWFEDMRKLAYDADALLDHVSLHLSNYCVEHSINANQENQVLSMVLSSFKELHLPDKINEMQKKLEDLVKEMESLVMIEKLKQDSCRIVPMKFSNLCSSTTPFVCEENVVGRVQDKEYMVGLLIQKNVTSNFSVIPIVGMGGIGKTTLAQLVYNDNTLRSCFDTTMWVSISMDFDVFKITKSIVESAMLSAGLSNLSSLQVCNLSDLSSLQVAVKHLLFRKTFLLVLDDYWSENHVDWELLCSPLRYSSYASKIIVTTRSTKVSSIVSISEACTLQLLSDDNCWELIKQRAFNNMEVRQNLESIGRQIASKCKGLPLAATTLGSVLHFKATEEEWSSVLESELWDMPQDKNVFPHLMLSYLHLPEHLQKCFAYCSIFPQNHEFEVEELVLLWMAEGFIRPVGSRRPEDIGNDYFNDLYSRSFFQKYTTTSNQLIYKMHDLIHDMARLVSQDICFHANYSMSNCYPLFGNSCHLSLLHDSNEPLELRATLENERLRTFLVMCNTASTRGKIHPQLFLKLKFLRVLGLSNIGLSELPDSIDNLEYLRYLNLSDNPIWYLPESMCKLVALQTLKLRNCSKLLELPKVMEDLMNLRHFEFDIRARLLFMPQHFGRLTSLQTLSAYIVGIKKGECIGELKNVNCLRGSLCIKNIHYVSDATDASEAKLSMKKFLDKLELQWKSLEDGPNQQVLNQRRNKQAQVLANLQPHGNLKELVIDNYCGVIYPDWLSESWRKFTNINLQGLKYCINLPSLGQLPFLKYFTISDMPCLENVDHDFYGTGNNVGFPSLESFQVSSMPILMHWIYASNSAMPCLSTFTVHDCPNLISLPTKLQSLVANSSIRGCPSLQLLP